MADKVEVTNTPSYRKIGAGRLFAMFLLCVALYFGLPMFRLIREIERLAFGPKYFDIEGTTLVCLNLAFSTLLLLATVGVLAALPNDVSSNVVFYTEIPIFGVHAYQLYSRCLPMVISYLSVLCYNTMRQSPEDPLVTYVCPRFVSMTWEEGAAPSPWTRHHFGELFIVSLYQGSMLFISIVFVSAWLDARGKNVELWYKLLYNDGTVWDLKLKPAIAVKVSATMGSVIDLLCEKGIEKDFEPVPVTADDSERLVGLVTLGNLLTHILRGRGTVDTPVSQVMTDLSRESSFMDPGITVNTSLRDLRRAFERNSAVVVTESTSDGAKAVHVVTKLDVLGYLSDSKVGVGGW